MKIYFKNPFHCYISTPKNEVPHLGTNFEESGFSVNLSLSPKDEKPLELNNVPSEDKYFVSTSSMEFTLTPLSDEKEKQFSYDILISDKERQKKFLKLVAKIINRTLQSMRNFGLMPHVHLFDLDLSYIDYYLSFLEVKLLDDQGERYISQQQSLLGMALSGVFGPTPQIPPASDLHIYRWPDIEEALQDQSEPPPEKEFFTNTIEFLRIGNFRMALLESIICLEIVLTQYLRVYLTIRRSFTNSKIRRFLSSQMGLSVRLSGLLDLTLTKDDLKDIDLNKVIRAVNWRNNIVHRTGRLPEQLTEQELRDSISSVLTLVLLLAQLRDRIQAEPALQDIAKKVSDIHNVPIPSIFDIGRHFIIVEIQFLFSALPENITLEKVAKDLSKCLESRDSRFVPEKHLFIRFLKFPKVTVARWRKDFLEVMQEQKGNT